MQRPVEHRNRKAILKEVRGMISLWPVLPLQQASTEPCQERSLGLSLLQWEKERLRWLFNFPSISETYRRAPHRFHCIWNTQGIGLDRMTGESYEQRKRVVGISAAACRSLWSLPISTSGLTQTGPHGQPRQTRVHSSSPA